MRARRSARGAAWKQISVPFARARACSAQGTTEQTSAFDRVTLRFPALSDNSVTFLQFTLRFSIHALKRTVYTLFSVVHVCNENALQTQVYKSINWLTEQRVATFRR